MGGTADPRDSSIGDLLKQLSTETSTLVKQELALARAELAEHGKQAGKGAGMLGAAGYMAVLFGVALTLFLVLALGQFMDTWLSALIVTVVYGAIAAVLALRGKKEIQTATPPAPQTVETVKEDVEWARTRTPSAAR
jgi:uncharacterized membrane protein YqjE